MTVLKWKDLVLPMYVLSNVALQKDYSGKTSNWPDLLPIISQFFSLLFIFILVLTLAYFCTRWIASNKNTKNSGRNISIIENLNIGYNSHLQIVKVGEKYILISLNKERVTYITDITKEEITYKCQNDKESQNKTYFKNFLDSASKK
jgi:flagellar protein FliO/FliZ